MPNPFSKWIAWSVSARRLSLVIMALVLGACSEQEAPWHAKNISGVMPDLSFSLTASNGKTVTAADYSGEVRLLFFGYTSCPDACPTTLAYLHRTLQQVPASLRDRIRILFVSVDPRRDTPAKLGQYAHVFDSHIVGLTSNEATLRDFAKRYRTTFGYGEADAHGNYEVSHSNAVYIFDGQGRIRLLLQTDLPTEAAAQDLTRLAKAAASGPG